jgi:hypothetical protein
MFATGPVCPANVGAQGRKLQVRAFFGKCCRNALRGRHTTAPRDLLHGVLNCRAAAVFGFGDDQAGEAADATGSGLIWNSPRDDDPRVPRSHSLTREILGAVIELRNDFHSTLIGSS